MDRADMINSLALAMGVTTDKDFDNSKYDTKTGTIYCNGRPVSDSTISNAIAYFETMKQKCDRSDIRNIKAVSSYYAAAIEALKSFQNNAIVSGQTTKMAI